MPTALAQPAAPAPQVSTRDDLVRLGQSGRAWHFLAIAPGALAQWPADHALRFLFAANLARCGLRTLATEQLRSLPAEMRAHADVTTLSRALSGLPDDRITSEHRRATCEANFARLPATLAQILHGRLPEWEAALSGVEYFKALDGNTVRRAAGDLNPLNWSGLFDYRTLATNSATRLRGTQFAAPAVIEGIDPPWMVIEARRATQPDAIGFAPFLYVVQADHLEFLSGLSVIDLGDLPADPRVQWYIGDDATSRLEEVLRARTDLILPEVLLASPSTRTSVRPWLQDVLQRTVTEQAKLADKLRVRLRTRCTSPAPRTPAWWRKRWLSAAIGGPPMRVLLPTSRYTTFVRHSIGDLARAFRRLGVQTRILAEPDPHSRLSSIAYVRAIDDFDPDLIVLANFPRSTFADVVPVEIPFVCWVQDAMPHLFDKAVGAGHGPLDFIAGHCLMELFDTYGFPLARAMPAAVVADVAKFHPGPVATDLRREHECDLALVSHHSEPPDTMHQRLCAETAHAPAIVAAFERLFPDLRRAVDESAVTPAQSRITAAVRDRLSEVLGRDADPRTITLVTRTYAMPVADRILRHQMIEWAAQLAEERGLRFHLYGKAWERHPRFSRFAKGELTHGEALRASYQCANLHLHASITTLVHQRVIECALSGGLCVSRFIRDATAGPKDTAHLALIDREPDARDSIRGFVGYTVADHHQTMSVAALLARLGVPLTEPVLWLTEKRLANMRRLRAILGADQDANALYGDLAEVTFADKPGLESLILRATANPAWRTAAADMIRRRALAAHTHDALARRLIAFVARSLDEQAHASPLSRTVSEAA